MCPRRLQDMGHQQCVGDRPNTAGYRGQGTGHGLDRLEVDVTDEPLAGFLGIVPCGITDGGVTSIERVSGRKPPMTDAVTAIVSRFGEVFDREIIAE